MGVVNYWLVGVAFLLGLLLTFALTIRRVKREVPVRSSTPDAPESRKNRRAAKTSKSARAGQTQQKTHPAERAGFQRRRTAMQVGLLSHQCQTQAGAGMRRG